MPLETMSKFSAHEVDGSRTKVRESKFWRPLWHYYFQAPSIALCRVPELEYASTLSPANVRFLDHCCGDGKFAELAWPGQMLTAGCDIDVSSIDKARAGGQYQRLDQCDAGKELPYSDCSFDIVFDNSAIEHIEDLDQNLREISRVLAPGGLFAFNVLNSRYFDWWPLCDTDKRAYRDWQPFYHALSIEQWEQRLLSAGLVLEGVQGYLDKPAARLLAWLDCEFSGKLLKNRRSILFDLYFKHPKVIQRLVAWRSSSSSWLTAPDAGAGFFIQARRLS